VFDNLRRDSVKYAGRGGWHANPGFWLVAVHRYGVWAHARPHRLLRLPFWIVYRIARCSSFFFNVHLWAGRRGSTIGPGFCLIHPNNIYVGPGTTIGADCTVYHEVTLGMGHVPGTPQIGDHCTIFAGARILGGVTIGDKVMVGANCVVTRSVAADRIVMPPVHRSMPRTLSPQARKIDGVTANSPSTPPHAQPTE
jgi:serine O-acetyltransferase